MHAYSSFVIRPETTNTAGRLPDDGGVVSGYCGRSGDLAISISSRDGGVQPVESQTYWWVHTGDLRAEGYSSHKRQPTSILRFLHHSSHVNMPSVARRTTIFESISFSCGRF